MDMIIVGRGKLANAIADHCHNEDGVGVYRFGDEDVPGNELDEPALVHAGSGREIEKALSFCSLHRTPFILASSEHDDDIPAKPAFPIVKAPNLALPIIAARRALIELHREIEILGLPYDVDITESHQQAKQNTSTTAKRMAEDIEYDEQVITSVRQPGLQRRLGVPEAHLDGHGYHWVTFRVGGLTLELSTRVDGRQPYGAGAVAIAEHLIHDEVSPGIHDAQHLMSY